MTTSTDETNRTDPKARGRGGAPSGRRRAWGPRGAIGLIGGLAVAASLGLVGTAMAKPGGECGGKGMHGHGGPGRPSLERLERRIERLGLPGEQQQAAYTILDRARSEQRVRRDAVRAAHEKMRALLSEEQPDARAVEAQADAIGALHTEAQKAHLRTLLALRPLMTSEQWQALQAPKRGAFEGGGPAAGEDERAGAGPDRAAGERS